MPAPESGFLLGMPAQEMPLTRSSSTVCVSHGCHVISGSDQMSSKGIDTFAKGAQSTGVKKPRKGAPTYDASERIHVPSGSGELRLVPRTSRAWGVWLVPDGVNACAGAEREQQEESKRHKRARQRAERSGRRE